MNKNGRQSLKSNKMADRQQSGISQSQDGKGNRNGGGETGRAAVHRSTHRTDSTGGADQGTGGQDQSMSPSGISGSLAQGQQQPTASSNTCHKHHGSIEIEKCEVTLKFVTGENRIVSETPVKLTLLVPEWIHIKRSKRLLQQLEDKLKKNDMILTDVDNTGKKLYLVNKAHLDPNEDTKKQRSKCAGNAFEEIRELVKLQHYFVPTNLHKSASDVLFNSPACLSQQGTVYVSQANGVFIFVADKEHQDKVFDEFTQCLSTLTEAAGTEALAGRITTKDEMAEKETGSSQVLLDQANQATGETFKKIQKLTEIPLSTTLNQFLKESDVARNHVVKELREKNISCTFDHESKFATIESPFELEIPVTCLDDFVRESTFDFSKRVSQKLFSLKEICTILEERYGGDDGKLMVLPDVSRQELTLVGIHETLVSAEKFIEQTESDFSNPEEDFVPVVEMSRKNLSKLEALSRILKSGLVNISRAKGAKSSVKIIGSSTSIAEFRDRMHEILSPLNTLDKVVEIEKEPLALLKAKSGAGVYLLQRAERNGLKVSVDTERKLYTIQGDTESGFDAKKFFNEWYRFRSLPVSLALKEMSEEVIRSCLFQSKSVDEEKVLVSLEGQKLTLIATADEYDKAEKRLDDIRVRKVCDHDTNRSKSEDCLTPARESGAINGNDVCMEVTSQTNAPEDSASQDQPETGDFAQIIFKENIWKQRDPEVENRTLRLTSYDASFLMNEQRLMSEVKKVLWDRHNALITNTQSDEFHDVKITVERRSGTLVDESKITEWKDHVCGIFNKIKPNVFQMKFRIKQNDLEAVKQLVLEKADQRFHATYIPVPEESCVVVVCFTKDSEKLMADLSKNWRPFLAEEQIDPNQNVQNFQSDKTDDQELPGGTNARPKAGNQEDNMTVKLALVMDEDEYQTCKSQFPTWTEIASHLKTYKPVDIMAGKKMIALEGQKKDVEVVVQRFQALLKQKTKSHHDHDEAAEYMKPVIVTDIAHTSEIRMALEIPEAHCRLLLTSQMIQNDSLKNMLKKEIVSSIESDGKHLLIWHKLNKDPAAAVEIVRKAVKHRIISLESYGETPFSTIKQVLEKEDNELIQVSQSNDDVWICFFAKMEAEVTVRLSQLNEEYEIDYECVSLKKDVYAYYMEFCQEDFKALRNDQKVEIELKMPDDDTYELFVRGTKQKVKAIVDIFTNKWTLVSKDMPVEEDNLAFFRTSEGAAFLKSIQSKNKCILSVVDNTEATFDASFQDGPREIYRYSPKSSDGKRTVSVVTGEPENWPTDIVTVPVWDVPQLAEKMSSFKKLGAVGDVDLNSAERRIQSLSYKRNNVVCFLEDVKLRDKTVTLAFVLLPNDFGDGAKKEKEKTIKAIAQLLGEVYKRYDLQTTLVNISEILLHLREKGMKSVFQAVKEVMNTEEHLAVEVIVLSESDEFAKKAKEALKKAFGENCPLEGYTEPELLVGELAKVTADVLVNTTREDLDLKNGAVSKSLLEEAGSAIQVECKNKYPNGINIGSFAETGTGKIKRVKTIYHGSLPNKDKTTSSEYIRKMLITFMEKCLKRASEKGYKSIAFPALGTGNLEYSVADVADVMFSCAEDFSAKNPHSSLKQMFFVLYPKDKETIQIFHAEETTRRLRPMSESKYTRPKAARFWTNGALFQIIQCELGDFKSHKDEIIYMVESSSVSDFVKSLRLLKGEEQRVNTDLKAKKNVTIVHHSLFNSPMIICVYKKEKIPEVWKKIFQNVDQRQFKIFMPQEASEFLFSKLVRFQDDKRKNEGYTVSVFVQTIEEFHRICSQFKAKTTESSSWLDMLWFWHSSKDDDSQQTVIARDSDPGAIRITAKTKEVIEDAFEEAVRYISQKLKKPSGAIKKSDQLAQKSIRSDEVGNAVSEDVKEEKEVSSMKQSQPSSGKDDLCWLLDNTGEMPHEIMDLLEQNGVSSVVFPHPETTKNHVVLFPEQAAVKLMDLLRKNRPVATDPCMSMNCRLEVKAEYISQMWEEEFLEKTGLSKKRKGGIAYLEGKYIQILAAIKYFKSSSTKEKASSAKSIPVTASKTVVQKLTVELNPVQYAAVKHFIDESSLTAACTSQQLPEGKVCLSFNESSNAELIHHRIVAFNSDSVEVLLTEEADIAALLKDVMKEHSKVYMQLSPDKKNVTIIAEEWAEMSAAKKKVQMKFGLNKPKSRARRNLGGNAKSEVSTPQIDNDDIQTPGSRPKTSRQISNGNGFVVGYLTVRVYETDMTKLPIDAIVNAANGNLSHGSGVARAIAVAAGQTLDDEGRRYVLENGTIPVTGVVATKAGQMPCKMVLHAVGPAWHDYSDKQKCFEDLCKTILRCLIEADNRGATAVAIPAISSGLFRVPKDICCEAYVRGTQLFGEIAKQANSLKEVHFVDLNKEMVKNMHEAFTTVSNVPITATEDETRFLRQYMKQNLKSKGGQKKSTPSFDDSVQSLTKQHSLLEPRKTGNGVERYSYSLDKKGVIMLYNSDIVTVSVDAHLLWENMQLKPITKAGHVLRQAAGNIDLKNQRKDLLATFVSPAGDITLAKTIVHAIVPASTLTTSDLETLFKRIIDTVNYNGCESVAITLVTSAKVTITDFGAALCTTFKELVKKGEKIPEIHIVDVNPSTVGQVKSVFDKFLTQESKEPSGVETGEECTICQDVMKDVKVLQKCGHKFCRKCIDHYFQKYKPMCPVCGAIYGAVIGDMPPGTMYVRSEFRPLPGYGSGTGKFIIRYDFPDGKQTEDHPNPGKWFKGTHRVAYLPDTTEGRTVLGLLKVAFDRKLTFTVGRSVTTGKEDAVTWNDIHHKTSDVHGGNFGYPDPEYLARVKDELAAKGVTQPDIDWSTKIHTFVHY